MADREPGQGRRDVFANATESVTGFAASGDPLEAFSPTDRLVFLAKAYRVPMSSVARALALSRETVYLRLRRITAELEAALEHGTLPRPRAWPCRCGHPRLPGRSYCRRCWRERSRLYMAARRVRQRQSNAP